MVVQYLQETRAADLVVGRSMVVVVVGNDGGGAGRASVWFWVLVKQGRFYACKGARVVRWYGWTVGR